VIDLGASLALLALTAVVGAAFAASPARRRRSARVEKDGGSALLGKPAMEATYWVLGPLAAALARAHVPANAVTVASVALASVAGLSFAAGHFGVGAVVAACAGLCDLVDGVVARANDTASPAGEVLDAAADRYGEFFVFAGLAIHARASLPYVALTLFALLGAVMTSYASVKAEAAGAQVPRGWMRRPERTAYLVLGAALVPWASMAVDLGWGVPVTREAPMVAALALVGALANVSAAWRLRALVGALQGPRPEAPAARRPFFRTLTRHQIAAVIATGVDFGTMVALVQAGWARPTRATLVGAILGGAVNFTLGRRWAFGAWREGPAPQALRYAVVSVASATLNAAGVQALHERLGVQYLAARAVVAVAVSLFWNYPMQRGFVFRRTAPARAGGSR
jgi:phosphatidylglycerophosphate synthase/putative flippase GtrA